jgi:NAD(P)-dependent dehydrogenase (short-subunit alcohol dehydrogenase family)
MSAQHSAIPADYQPPHESMAGQVAVITGAADGLGRALAVAAAGQGATVILLDRNVRKLELVYDAIEQSGGPQPAIYPLNLETATPEHFQELAATLEENFGRLDALVHNAATLGKLAPLEHAQVGAWFSTLQTNLTAPFLLTQQCLPLLRRAENGSILFIGDAVGRRARAYWGAYAVSKFGVEGLMQVLADELAENTRIRVNSIDPGAVRTGLRRTAYPGEDAQHLPTPEQVVGALLYVLGPQARHLHGQQLTVDAPA